jgi:hypothetical protein
MSINKPSESEEEYFAREEAAKQRHAAHQKAHAIEAAQKDALKQAHFMHCPKCGMELHTVRYREVQVERCFHCHGTWFDEKQLETLLGKEPTFLARIAAVFKSE